MMSEKLAKFYDLKIQQKELEITERRQRLEAAEAQKTQLTLPAMAMVSGALELRPDAQGLSGAVDQLEQYEAWLESWLECKIAAILGKRGSGKSVLIGKIAEYLNAKYGTQIFWVGLPPQARQFLPKWIQMVDSVDQCPPNSFVVTDEAGVNYLSLAFNTDRNKLLRMQLMIARHKNCSMAFAVQSSRDMDASIVRLADCFIFKEPSLHQPLSERQDMKGMAKKAALVFEQIPKDERRQAAYVFDSSFEGVIKSALPSFWSEELSHIYATLDLNKIQADSVKRKELQQVTTQEAKLLDMASLDKNILELKRQGEGIERIAKTLGCTPWRVRKTLESAGRQNP